MEVKAQGLGDAAVQPVQGADIEVLSFSFQ